MRPQFKILEVASFSHLEIFTADFTYTFYPSYVYNDSFNELVTAIYNLRFEKSKHEIVTFDLETDGVLYMIISAYPYNCFRLTLIDNVDWFIYEESFDILPPPKAVVDIMMTDMEYFGYNIASELKRWEKDDFYGWNCDFFDEKLEAIAKMK